MTDKREADEKCLEFDGTEDSIVVPEEVVTDPVDREAKAEEATERVAVNPKTGKQRTIGPGQSLPNGWQWS